MTNEEAIEALKTVEPVYVEKNVILTNFRLKEALALAISFLQSDLAKENEGLREALFDAKNILGNMPMIKDGRLTAEAKCFKKIEAISQKPEKG